MKTTLIRFKGLTPDSTLIYKYYWLQDDCTNMVKHKYTIRTFPVVYHKRKPLPNIEKVQALIRDSNYIALDSVVDYFLGEIRRYGDVIICVIEGHSKERFHKIRNRSLKGITSFLTHLKRVLNPMNSKKKGLF